MVGQVLFIQGAGEGTYDHWDNRLVESLREKLGPDYQVHYPRMPDESDPDYPTWRNVIAQELARLGDGVILVGHSAGGTILVNALVSASPPQPVAALMLLAAPYCGAGGWPSDELGPQDKLGAELLDGMPVYLYQGTNDDSVPFAHMQLYAKAIPQAVIRSLENRDHQFDNDMSEVAKDIRSLS